MRRSRTLAFGCGLLGASIAAADVLELKDGRVINGTYLGGTSTSVRFDAAGQVSVIETTGIVALTFTTAAPAAAAVPATGQATVVVPAGTMLLVRMMDTASSNSKAGTKFTTTLEADLRSGDVVIAPAGTKVYGVVASSKQAGRLAGKSVLDLRLEAIQINGRNQAIATGSYKQASAASLKKTAGAAAVGAVIGGAAAGEAGKGAAIGTAVSVLKKGDTTTVPPGVLLEFQLVQPANLIMTK